MLRIDNLNNTNKNSTDKSIMLIQEKLNYQIINQKQKTNKPNDSCMYL